MHDDEKPAVQSANSCIQGDELKRKRIKMFLYAKCNTELPANTTAVIQVTYAKKKLGKPNHALLVATSAVQPNKLPILVGNALLHIANIMAVPYVNLTNCNITVKRGDILAYAEELFPEEHLEDENIPPLEDTVHAECDSVAILEKDLAKPRDTGSSKEQDEKIRAMIKQVLKNTECPDHLLPKLEAMLWKNLQILADMKDQVGLIKGYQPTIDLDTDKPMYVPQFPISFKMRALMKETIDAFLKDGIITPSKSPYNHPINHCSEKGHRCTNVHRLPGFERSYPH